MSRSLRKLIDITGTRFSDHVIIFLYSQEEKTHFCPTRRRDYKIMCEYEKTLEVTPDTVPYMAI